MNNLTKPILITGVLLLTLVACTRTAVVNDTARIVAKAAAQIAAFELPPGYEPEFGLHALGYTVVAYNPGDDRSHLYLIQSEEAAGGAALERVLQELVPGSQDAKTRMTVREQRPFTLRDQPVTLIISTGTNGAGEAIQQLTTLFQGKNGPVLLVLSEPVARWNQATIDTFLASIH